MTTPTEDVRVPMTSPLDSVRAGIGVIAPHDFALDHELLRWTPDDVSIYSTRTPYVPPAASQVESVANLANHDAIAEACRAISTPAPKVVAYMCTSCTFVHGAAGDAAVRALMERHGAPHAITTSGALIDAIHALGASRIAIATPYGSAATHSLRLYLSEHGVDVVAGAYLDLTGNIWRVGRGAVEALALSVPLRNAEALFISCTNLATCDLIVPLERKLGIPVLSANMVTMWAALRTLDRNLVGGSQRLSVLT